MNDKCIYCKEEKIWDKETQLCESCFSEVDQSYSKKKLLYYCDDLRHIVCIPYSVENLHKMAEDLKIKRCWFHKYPQPHYDIPIRRYEEIKSKSIFVNRRDIVRITLGQEPLL